MALRHRWGSMSDRQQPKGISELPVTSKLSVYTAVFTIVYALLNYRKTVWWQ